MTIKNQFLVYFLLPVFLAFLTLRVLDYRENLGQATVLAVDSLQNRTQATANRVNTLLIRASTVAITTARLLSTHADLDEAELERLLKENIEDSPLIYGAAIAFEPGVYKGRALFSPYAFKAGQTVKVIDIATAAYDYTRPEWEWYAAPKRLGRPVWTEPYFDQGAGDIWMVTYSVPFYRGSKLAGITTIDLDLSKLPELAKLPILERSLFFLVSEQGAFVYHNQAINLGRPLTEDPAEFMVEFARAWRAAGPQGASLPLASAADAESGKLWSSMPVESVGWRAVLRLDDQAELAPVRARLRHSLYRAILTLCLALGGAWWFIYRIITPLGRLSQSAKAVTEGQRFDYPVAQKTRTSGNEVDLLAHSIDEMTTRLQAREQALLDAKHLLEDRVAERTEELADKVGQLSGILRTMLDCVVHIDAKGQILLVNDATCQVFGYDPDALIGQNVSMLMPEPHRSAHDGYLARFQQLGRGQVVGRRVELEAQRSDGTRFPIDLSVSPISEDPEDGYIGVIRDITARREAEDALVAARQEAERLARVKSEFLANMSHEIRTPLNAVLGFARMGVRGKDPESIGHCQRILEAGNHLLSVINDILDFSKIEAGRVVCESAPFELGALLQRCYTLMEQVAREKGLRYQHTDSIDWPCWVQGDAQRVQQILVNLIANAIKFTEQGEVRLRVGRDDDMMVFRIIDTGIGMTPEQVARLFKPFEQADGSTTRRFGGTGLGLAISANLAHLMGGYISVDSAPGQGSAFTLRLPLRSTAPVDIAAKPVLLGDAQRLAGMKILAADDIEVNRVILADLLQLEGAEVTLVNDGQAACEAVERTATGPFDVVLLDIQMPVMDGIEACRRILAGRPQQVLIGLTAYATREDRERCLAAGMRDHVAKPVDPDILVAAILQHTDGIQALGHEGNWASPAAAAAIKPELARSPEAPANPACPVDWPGLVARYGGRRAFVRKIALAAVNGAGEQAQALRDAADATQHERIARAAHAIKGQSGYMMATALHDFALRTEHAAKQLEAETPELARQLADAYDCWLEALRQGLDSGVLDD